MNYHVIHGHFATFPVPIFFLSTEFHLESPVSTYYKLASDTKVQRKPNKRYNKIEKQWLLRVFHLLVFHASRRHVSKRIIISPETTSLPMCFLRRWCSWSFPYPSLLFKTWNLIPIELHFSLKPTFYAWKPQLPIDDNSGRTQKICEKLLSDHQRDADLSKFL